MQFAMQPYARTWIPAYPGLQTSLILQSAFERSRLPIGEQALSGKSGVLQVKPADELLELHLFLFRHIDELDADVHMRWPAW